MDLYGFYGLIPEEEPKEMKPWEIKNAIWRIYPRSGGIAAD
jgi:hypothetical protein